MWIFSHVLFRFSCGFSVWRVIRDCMWIFSLTRCSGLHVNFQSDTLFGTACRFSGMCYSGLPVDFQSDAVVRFGSVIQAVCLHVLSETYSVWLVAPLSLRWLLMIFCKEPRKGYKRMNSGTDALDMGERWIYSIIIAYYTQSHILVLSCYSCAELYCVTVSIRFIKGLTEDESKSNRIWHVCRFIRKLERPRLSWFYEAL